MLGNIFPLDSSKPFTTQEKVGHNRYHPEIPPRGNGPSRR